MYDYDFVDAGCESAEHIRFGGGRLFRCVRQGEITDGNQTQRDGTG